MKNLIERNLIYPNQTKPSYQMKIVALTFLATVIPVTLIFTFFNLVKKTSLGFLTRDPAALTNTPIYIGLFSNIGILLWCSCATICIFSYAILKPNNRSRNLSKFLLFSGLLTAFLTLDDLFMLHEVFFPKYLNIQENLVYAFYIVIILFGFGRNIAVIKKTEFIILFAAIGFFALSIVSDKIYSSYAISIMEEVCKVIGITTWLTYLTRLCLREISSIVRLSSASEDF
jgi:hypothetical protein